MSDYECSYFLKEKSESKNVILDLIENLRTQYGIQVKYE